MTRLIIKIRVFGKRNQKFLRFILVPRLRSQKGRYHTILGYKENYKTPKLRYIVMNIYLIMYYYSYGALATRKVIDYIYKYFIDVNTLNKWIYFSYPDFMLIIDNEIKKKYS